MGSRLDGLGAIEMNTLCSREFIYPFEFDTRQSTEGCGLGLFFEVTDEQAARLLELGNANRQSATLSAEPAPAP
jgi:hypothetical protein